MKWLLPIDLAYPALLVVVTGYGYFTSIFPTSWTTFLDAHNIRSLDTMLWWMTAITAIKALACFYAMATQDHHITCKNSMALRTAAHELR